MTGGLLKFFSLVNLSMITRLSMCFSTFVDLYLEGHSPEIGNCLCVGQRELILFKFDCQT